MIAYNIFRAIGDFFTTILFYPFNALRSLDNWWLQSIVNWIFVILTLVAFLYWLNELNKVKNTENE